MLKASSTFKSGCILQDASSTTWPCGLLVTQRQLLPIAPWLFSKLCKVIANKLYKTWTIFPYWLHKAQAGCLIRDFVYIPICFCHSCSASSLDPLGHKRIEGIRSGIIKFDSWNWFYKKQWVDRLVKCAPLLGPCYMLRVSLIYIKKINHTLTIYRCTSFSWRLMLQWKLTILVFFCYEREKFIQQ